MVNGIKRVILVNDSRLLLGLFRRVIEKTKHLRVVGEMGDLRNISQKITETNADWVIVNEERDEMNLEIIDELMNAHPSVRFLTVTADGSQVSMKYLEMHEENLSSLTLSELLKILAFQQ